MWKDANGREWSTAITVATVKRVKEHVGIFLTDVDAIEKIDADVMLLCDVLAAICKPQRDDRNVSADQFGELLAGKYIDLAYDSLRQDLLDFFPHSRRKMMQRIFATTQEVEAEKLRVVEQALTEDQVALMVKMAGKKVKDKLALELAKLGDESGKSPELSE